jgi:hypothetical protein
MQKLMSYMVSSGCVEKEGVSQAVESCAGVLNETPWVTWCVVWEIRVVPRSNNVIILSIQLT